MDGLTSFANIATAFPHISSCRLLVSDQEVGHLNDLPHLRQLEVAGRLKERKSDFFGLRWNSQMNQMLDSSPF